MKDGFACIFASRHGMTGLTPDGQVLSHCTDLNAHTGVLQELSIRDPSWKDFVVSRQLS